MSLSFFPTGHQMCPTSGAGTKCSVNFGVWGYECCDAECCGKISGFGWVCISVLGTLLVVAVALALYKTLRRH
ncbi:hypothetical protein Y032_0119g787 [Ancylostoma ceylanicum]|uniref:Uncharacterized protein n=1 Tax=Ancylostoma ceylanicum TaxID=53326 RepID=A0A016TAV0_9BILA|nr:hypothetical protein Y032_0119g787 [Ancylostoma ceylanicum]